MLPHDPKCPQTGYALLDLERGEVSPSLGAAAMLGVPRWRMRLEVLRQFIEPVDRDPFDALLGSLHDGHVVTPIPVHLRAVDGSLREVHVSVDTHEGAALTRDPLMPAARATLVFTEARAEAWWTAAMGEATRALDTERRALATMSADFEELAQLAERQRQDLARIEAEHERALIDLHRERVARIDVARELERMALCDPLTGLASRRRFFEDAEREMARARRHGRPLALLLLDLDGFAKIGERWGHGVSDRALCHASTAIRGVPKRPSDLVARIGGEELGLLLPDTREVGAIVVAERLRLSLGRAPFVLRDDVVTMTASIGVAELLDTDESLDAAIVRADRALRVAKGRGGNRWERFEEEEAGPVSRHAGPAPSRAAGA